MTLEWAEATDGSLVHTGSTPSLLSCNTPRKDPSLAVFFRYQPFRLDISSWDCVPPPPGKHLLCEVEKWRVRWKEKWHHPGTGWTAKRHIVPYNYTQDSASAVCSPLLAHIFHRDHSGIKTDAQFWNVQIKHKLKTDRVFSLHHACSYSYQAFLVHCVCRSFRSCLMQDALLRSSVIKNVSIRNLPLFT